MESEKRAAQQRMESEKRAAQQRRDSEKRAERQRQEWERRNEQQRMESEQRAAQNRKEYDERREQNRKESDRRLAEMDQRFAEQLTSFRDMLDYRFGAMNKRIDDMTQHFTERVASIHDEVVEIRRESKVLRWNIWIAACTTVIGVAGAMSAMNSTIISAFESGRNSSTPIVRQSSAPAMQVPSPNEITNLSSGRPRKSHEAEDVSAYMPLHRREDTKDTLEDNQPQS